MRDWRARLRPFYRSSTRPGRLLGIIHLDDAHLASQTPDIERLVLAADLTRADVTPLTTEDWLDYAQEQFVEQDSPALPVVNSREDCKVLGLAKRLDVASAYMQHVRGQKGQPES